MAKQYQIVRLYRGKLDKNIDKEFDEVITQIEDKFNGILDKLNTYETKNIDELRSINMETITLNELTNLVGTLINDLKEIFKSY